MSRDAFREYIAQNYKDPVSRAIGASPSAGASLPPPPSGPPQQAMFRVSPPSDVPQAQQLPAFKAASQITPTRIVLPPLLIDGLLHRGCKIMLSGGSKSFKSWCLMDLAVSVAEGITWWGQRCHRGKVLYLNFELIEPFFESRLVSICRARNCALPSNLLFWSLRGACYDLAILASIILARSEEFGPFDLIVVDPIYKALGDLDENSASDMTKLMNLIEVITVKTGSAVAFGSHFSKGNQSTKEAKDRPSGSGVLIRDPDAILTMTRHQEEGCYTINSELRYLQSLPEFVVRWNFPIMQADESLDPRQLYSPGAKDDSKSPEQTAFSTSDVLECLPIGGAQDTLWRKMVSMKFNRSGEAYYSAKAELLKQGLVVKQGLAYYRATYQLNHPV